MGEAELVSVVVPCYNPTSFLRETLASIAAQTHRNIEVIVVNDGTNLPESLALLKDVAGQASLYLEQSNRGLAAARNTGFRAAKGSFVLPLDADDLIQPTYVAECLAALKKDEAAAFVYTDYQVFGTKKYSEHPGEYNLYRLLDRNYFTYASLIRKPVWEAAGGYDDSMRLGYEDWEFWLRLGSRGCYGCRLPRILFHYRKHAASLYDTALAHHDQLVAYIQSRHPELYGDPGRMRVKAHWQPAVCIVGAKSGPPQTIQDVLDGGPGDVATLLGSSPAGLGAQAVVVSEDGRFDANTAEMAALAVWSGHASVRLPDGSVALSRRAALSGKKNADASLGAAPVQASPAWGRTHRHLLNADLLSWRSWVLHPIRSLVRLIPLRMKERVNQSLGKPFFDLSFYLQFQPKAVALDFGLVELLEYCPAPPDGRQRLAVVVPHLGAGGAESVLLDILGSLDRTRFEILVLATQSKDSGWISRWNACGDHVYDLATVVSPEKMVSAICSFVKNWRCETVLVQNSLYGYAALPQMKRMQHADGSHTRTIDVIHAIDKTWDQVSASGGASSSIDVRVAVSDAVQQRLLAGATPAEQIRVIRGGVDLERFRPAPTRASGELR
ncbi:MAG TPA: glycosyltransferase, partial [Bryobacteraceae bacterium]